MDITKFNKDLNIIQALADEPNDAEGLSPNALKERFDRGGNLIKDYINNTLLPEIQGNEGAAKVGAKGYDNCATVQQVLDYFYTDFNAKIGSVNFPDCENVQEGLEYVYNTLSEKIGTIPFNKASVEAALNYLNDHFTELIGDIPFSKTSVKAAIEYVYNTLDGKMGAVPFGKGDINTAINYVYDTLNTKIGTVPFGKATVKDALDYLNNQIQNAILNQIPDGSLTKAKLDSSVRATLDKADSALQSVDDIPEKSLKPEQFVDLPERKRTMGDLFKMKDIDAKRYGVKFTGSASAGVRTYNAEGLVAGVGTDTQSAVNDFDHIMPWAAMRRCNTALVDGERQPTYFEGEAGYSNTEADVFVYVPLFYYYKPEDDSETIISMQPLAGYIAPKKFRRADGTLKDHCFLAAYLAGIDENGIPVSRSGYIPSISSHQGWVNKLKQKHTSGDIGGDIWFQGLGDYEIICALLDVEFATRDHQTVMQGCTGRQKASTHVATAGGVNQLTMDTRFIQYYQPGFPISIGTADGDNDIAEYAVIHTADATTGLITFTPPGEDITVAAGNFIRPSLWKSGICDNVIATSGAPVSPTDTMRPCIYRGVENPWGNAHRWCIDLYTQEEHIYVLDSPENATGAMNEHLTELSYTMPVGASTTVEGQIKRLGFDERFPYARLPVELGASSSTYYANYYYRSSGFKAAVFGGYLYCGRYAGCRYLNLGYHPTWSPWTIAAALSPL